MRHFEGLDELSEIKKLGFLLILVTNQPDIERGIIPAAFVEELNQFYQKRFNLDAAYCCPYASNVHPMKKPNPGMFLQAAKDFSLDLSKSFHLGDTERDIEAAMRCGCKSILLDRPYNKGLKADLRITSLKELHTLLISETEK